jgi:hypothetical protein
MPKMYPIHLGHAAANMGPAAVGDLSDGELKPRMCHLCKNIQNAFNTTTISSAPGPPAAAIPQAEELYAHYMREMHYICMTHMLVDAPDVRLKEEEVVLSMRQSQRRGLSPPSSLECFLIRYRGSLGHLNFQ